MGRDLRGRASFTRSTVTDTVARLSRPLDRLSLSLSLFSKLPVHIYTEYIYIYIYSPILHEECTTPLSWHEIRNWTTTMPGNDTSPNGNREREQKRRWKRNLLFFSLSVRLVLGVNVLYIVAVIGGGRGGGGGGANWNDDDEMDRISHWVIVLQLSD